MSKVPAPKRATAHSVVGSLARRRSGKIEAWYLLGEQNTSGLPPHEERHLIEQFAYSLSRMQGYKGRIRVSARPFQVQHWGIELEKRAVDPLPAAEGVTFADWVEAQGHALAESSSAEPAVYAAVVLHTAVSKRSWRKIKSLLKRQPWEKNLPHPELVEELRQVDETMAGVGVQARRATTAEIDWLTHRGTTLGAPAPSLPYLGGSVLDEQQMRAYTDPSDTFYDPREKTLDVEVQRSGQPVRRRVAILVASQIAGRRLHPLDQSKTGWLTYHRKLGLPEVEWSVDYEVVDSRRNVSSLLNMVTRLRNIKQEYEDNDTAAPIDLDMAEQQAMVAHQAATSSDQIEATEVHARIYCMVPGATEDEVRRKVERITDRYSRDMGITLTWAPEAQYAFTDAFIPGVAPPTFSGLRPEMPARLFATSLPNSASTLGDGEGWLAGQMADDPNSKVLIDLHYVHKAEVDLGGSVAVIASQGYGKTTTTNKMLYSQAQMGDHVAYFAPDGQGARLGRLPEIAPYFQNIDLTGEDAEPGILAPTQLIPPTRRSAYPTGMDGDKEHRAALARSTRARSTFIYERLYECLPYNLQVNDGTEGALTTAIGARGTEYGLNPWRYIDELMRGDEYAQKLAQVLAGLAEQSVEGQLLFPTDRVGEVGLSENYHDNTRRITVVSLQELKAPRRDTPPAQWNRSQRLFFPVMASAAYLTARMVYADFTTPTTTAFDEGKKLARSDSGSFLMSDMAENASRKHKAAVIFTMLDTEPLETAGITNLMSMWLLGHMESTEMAERAARHMGREEDARRIAEQAKLLGKGEWFMRDAPRRSGEAGRFGKMRWTLDENPTLLQVLTSEQMRVRDSEPIADTSDEVWERPAA